jgi:formamidopyrimidine-DNA glycosylase
MLRRQPNPADFVARLRNRTVRALRRHGKFLIAEVGDFLWVTHLGMSGRMQVAAPGAPEAAHTNVVVTVKGAEVRFVDPRTFGFVAAFTPAELAQTSIAALGPDALTDLPRAPRIVDRLRGRKAAIKPLLLNQSIVSGIGNIYADEVLWRARVSPHRAGGSLTPGEVGAIRSAIRPVLEAGLRHGGTSLDDLAYLLPDGRAGNYMARLEAYGREDEPCSRCGGAIRRDVIGQRSSFWCPRCQA